MMGPNILLGKSTLQSLSKRETGFLFKHYSVVVPPVLVRVIIADLEKPDRNGTGKGSDVPYLAEKLNHTPAAINAPFEEMCLASLFGASIELDCWPKRFDAQLMKDTKGRPFLFVDQTDAEKTLRILAHGGANDEILRKAQDHHLAIEMLDLEGFVRNYGPQARKMMTSKNLTSCVQEAKRMVDTNDKGLIL
jgi:hypothetical protein